MAIVYALVLGVCMASLSPSEMEIEQGKSKEVPGWQTRPRRSALSDQFLRQRIQAVDSVAKFVAAASDMYITLDEARQFVVLDRLRGPQLHTWAELVQALRYQAHSSLLASPNFEQDYSEDQMAEIVNSVFGVECGEPRLLLQLGEVEHGELPVETALGNRPQLIDYVIDSVDSWLSVALEDSREAYEAVRYSPRLSLGAASGNLQSLIFLMKKNNGWAEVFTNEMVGPKVIERLAEIDVDSFLAFVPTESRDEFKSLVAEPTRGVNYIQIPDSISDEDYLSISNDVFAGVVIADQKFLPPHMDASKLMQVEDDVMCAQAFSLLYFYFQGVSARWLAQVSGRQASLE